MKIGLALLCAGTVLFMLRVLIALLAGATNRFNLPTKVYMATFNPKSKPSIRRGDLIIMNSNEDVQKTPTRKAAGTAFVLTAGLLLAIPTHAHKTSDNSAGNIGASPSQPSTTDQELFKELDVMTKRIVPPEPVPANEKSREQPTSEAQASVKEVELSRGNARFAAAAAPPPRAETRPGEEEPFAFADWTRLNGNARTKASAFSLKIFAPEIRANIDYVRDFKVRFKLVCRSFPDTSASNDIFRTVSLRGQTAD